MVRQNRPYCSQILSLLLAVPTLAYSQGAEPKLTAERAVVMDAASGIILWSKNANQIGYPASTTKILTALLLIENTNPGDVIIGPPRVDKVGESSLHIKPGEKLTADALLKGLMLRSANDAAYMVAIQIGGSVNGVCQDDERARPGSRMHRHPLSKSSRAARRKPLHNRPRPCIDRAGSDEK